MKILAVHCDGLGDAAFAVPFLSILPTQYPEAELYLVCGRGRKKLYFGLKEYVVLETNEKDKITEILDNEFDIVFDLNGGERHITNYFKGISLKYLLYVGFEKPSAIKNEIQISVQPDVPRWQEYYSFIPGLNGLPAWNNNFRLKPTKLSGTYKSRAFTYRLIKCHFAYFKALFLNYFL